MFSESYDRAYKSYLLEKHLYENKLDYYATSDIILERMKALNEMWFDAYKKGDNALADYYKTIQHKQYYKKELLPYAYLSKVYKDIVGYRQNRVL